MGFSRQEHWSRLPFPAPGDLPSPGIKPALAGAFFTTEPPGKPIHCCNCTCFFFFPSVVFFSSKLYLLCIHKDLVCLSHTILCSVSKFLKNISCMIAWRNESTVVRDTSVNTVKVSSRVNWQLCGKNLGDLLRERERNQSVRNLKSRRILGSKKRMCMWHSLNKLTLGYKKEKRTNVSGLRSRWPNRSARFPA